MNFHMYMWPSRYSALYWALSVVAAAVSCGMVFFMTQKEEGAFLNLPHSEFLKGLFQRWRMTNIHEHGFRSVPSDNDPYKDEYGMCFPFNCSKVALDDQKLENMVSALLDDIHQCYDSKCWSSFKNQRKSIQEKSAGIVMTMGGPPRADSLTQAFVTLTVLRHHHHSTVPVAVFHAGEPGMAEGCAQLAAAFPDLSCHNALEEAAAYSWPAVVPSFALEADWVRGFPVKALALLLAPFRGRALLLDSDALPAEDPEEAAAGGEGEGGGPKAAAAADATAAGAEMVLWPDLGLAGDRARVGAARRRFLGAAVAAAGDWGPAESGQLVVDSEKCWPELWTAWLLNAHPFVYTLIYGDKDTYQLAAEILNAHRRALAAAAAEGGGEGSAAGGPPPPPPCGVRRVGAGPWALGGYGMRGIMADGRPISQPNGFCGQALVQVHPDHQDKPAFIHRTFAKYNTDNLLTMDSWKVTAQSSDCCKLTTDEGWCMILKPKSKEMSPLGGGATTPHADDSEENSRKINTTNNDVVHPTRPRQSSSSDESNKCSGIVEQEDCSMHLQLTSSGILSIANAAISARRHMTASIFT